MAQPKRWLLLAGLTLALPVLAESGRYDPWNPSPSGGDLDRLLNELDEAIDDASRDRAANPDFLRDLREILDRHRAARASTPALRPGRPAIADDFDDGDYTRNPTWTVQSGRFRVDRSGALFSEVSSGASALSGSSSQKDPNLELVLGVMEILGGSKGGASSTSSATGQEGAARIVLNAPVANAFELSASLRADTGEGALAVGVFQEASGDAYQVLYHADSARRTLQLVKFTRGAAKLVDSEELTRVALDDGRAHALGWSRNSRGEMTVSLDGREILRATDATFRDPFAGLAVTNHGGAFAVDDMQVKGN